MHTRAAPKERRQDPALYGDDVVGDVLAFLRERIAVALAAGVAPEQLIVDPGPDFAKTPAQTIALLRRLDELHALGRPILLAASRKDFIGAVTGRAGRARPGHAGRARVRPRRRAPTCSAVHDVRGAADFVRVRAVLRGEAPVGEDLALAEDVRHERPLASPPVADG
jgi:dihydropteroate synthase